MSDPTAKILTQFSLPGMAADLDALRAKIERMRVQRDAAQDERAAIRGTLVDASIYLPYPSPIWDRVNEVLGGTPAVSHV